MRKMMYRNEPKVHFWLETDSTDAEYIIPKPSSADFGRIVRIRFEDGTFMVTKEVRIDLSNKTGVKRIEYLSINNIDNLSAINITIPLAYTSKQILIDYLGVDENDPNIVKARYNERYAYSYTNDITDADIENITGSLTIGSQKFTEVDIHDRITSFSMAYNSLDCEINIDSELITDIHLNRNEKDIVNVINAPLLKSFTAVFGKGTYFPMSGFLNLTELFIEGYTIIGNTIIDLTHRSVMNYMFLKNTNHTDIFFADYYNNYIEIQNCTNLNNIEKVIPSTPNLIISNSAFKSVTISDTSRLKVLNLNSHSLSNTGNQYRGIDVINFTSCTNLEGLLLRENIQMLKTYSDFSIFTKLKTLEVSGNGTPQFYTLPNSLRVLSIIQFSSNSKGFQADLTNLSLAGLTINYTVYSTSDIIIGQNTLDDLSYFETSFSDYNLPDLTSILNKIATNPINNGSFYIRLYQISTYNNTPYQDLPQDIKDVIAECSALKAKGWSFHTATDRVIRDNI